MGKFSSREETILFHVIDYKWNQIVFSLFIIIILVNLYHPGSRCIRILLLHLPGQSYVEDPNGNFK